MITIYFIDIDNGKSFVERFDYPDQAVEFIKRNKHIFVTSIECVDAEDNEYITTHL